MAGDAAGQITASLTLDIKGFTDAIKKAQDALDKLNGRTGGGGGGGGGASKPKIPGTEKKTLKAIRETIKNVKSLSDQIKGNKATTEQAKQALAGYEKSLERLGATVKRDTEEFRQFNKGIAAVGGMKSFINVSDTASSKMSKLTSQVENGGSKMSNVFAAMSTGGSGAMRATVMSFTNITEAFQKGLMGGRQFAMFFMGDLSDAMMIGSFHASGFAKAAAVATGSTKALLMGMARWVIPAQVAITALMGVLGLLAAKMGWFGAKTKGAKEEVAKATAVFKRSADQLTVLEAEVSMVGVAFSGFIKRANELEKIDINKALDPMQALASAANELSRIKLGKFGVQILQIANFITEATTEVEKLRQRVLDLQDAFAMARGSGELLQAQKELSGLLQERLQLTNMLALTEAQQIAKKALSEDLDKKINAARARRNSLANHELELIEKIKDTGDRVVAQEKILLKGQEDKLKFEKEIAKIKAENAKKDTAKDTEKKVDEAAQQMAKDFVAATRESIATVKVLEKRIEELYARIKAAPTAQQEGLLGALGVKKTEKQLDDLNKSIEKRISKAVFIDPKLALELEGMKNAAELQKQMAQNAALQAREAERVKDAMLVAAAATRVGIRFGTSKKSHSQAAVAMTPSQIAGAKKDIAGRENIASFMAPLVGGAENVSRMFKKIGRGSRDIVKSMGDWGAQVDGTAESLTRLGMAAVTAASVMTATFGQAAMGDFGNFMAGAGGAAGAGVGVAMGVDPATGQAVGGAIGGFADMLLGKMQISTGGMNDDGTAETVGLMQIISDTFEQNLLPAIEAMKPFASVLFFVASRMSSLFGMMFDALGPLIDVLASLFLDQLRLAMAFVVAWIPLFQMVGAVFEGLGPVIKGLSRALINVVMIVAFIQLIISQFVSAVVGGIGTLLTFLGALTGEQAWATKVMEGFSTVVIDVVDGLHAFLSGIGNFLVFLAGDNPLLSAMKDLGNDLVSTADAFRDAFTADLGELGKEIENAAGNYRTQNDQMKETNKEASKVLNAPKGFKVEKYRYEAMNPNQTNPFTGASLDGQSGTVINIENLFVDNFTDLEQEISKQNQTGGVGPLGGF
tara:strand:+ start:10309 stop:13575 length:3267 start_codon:yes stop_codon:yes gene_type:complete